MDLRALRYYVAVAEELSFTRAAARLRVAQPALSVAVRRLEQELAVELVDRSRRAIALTPAGQVMLDEARGLLAGLERSLDRVRRTGQGALGHLDVGFVPSAANAALPPLLRSFAAGHPDVHLRLREMSPDDLVRALHDRRLDLAVLYLPFADDALEQHVVAREHFVVALPAGHELAATGAGVPVAALAEEPFVLPARHGMPGLHAKVLDLCREAGFTPRAVQEDVWLVQTIVGLVAARVGVALVPANAQAMGGGLVVYRPLAPPDAASVELAAIWRRDDRSPVLRAFRREIGDPGAAAGGPGRGGEVPAGRGRVSRSCEATA